MTIEEALHEYLSGKTEITDLVGERIYPIVLPQGVLYPALTYIKISGPVLHDVDIAYPRLQLGSWGDKYSDVKQLAAAVKEVLQRFKGIMGSSPGIRVSQVVFVNELDFYDPETGTYHIPADYTIIYREV
jgi:hypothetical protein